MPDPGWLVMSEGARPVTGWLAKAILGAGCVFVGGLFIVVLNNLLSRPLAWRDLFSERPGGPPNLARYLLVFGNLFLALQFLVMVLKGQAADAMKFVEGLNLDALTGASGGAYLLSKVTNGDILSLLGRRRPE